MKKRVILLLVAIAVQAGCKSQPNPAASAVASAAVPLRADSPNGPAPSQDVGRANDSATSAPGTSQYSAPPDVPAAAQYQYSDPPTASVGPSVEEAYAAIPHRRTIWDQSSSTVPSDEKDYVQTMFQVLDQAVRVRVAGQQAFSARQFDSADIDGEFNRLIAFVRGMPVPKSLGSYHQKILSALSNERQYFADWKSQRDRFPFAEQVANHPGVRAASASLRSAYDELMAKYPSESPANKDAFFDYHCALDFL